MSELDLMGMAIRGMRQIVAEAETRLKTAIERYGADAPVTCPGAACCLPVIYGLRGHKVEKLGDLLPALAEAEQTPDAGEATLLAEEIIEAIRSIDRYKTGMAGNGPVDDAHLRAWGIQLLDGRMPGFVLIMGCAPSSAIAAGLVRELRSRNMLTFLSGKSIVEQLVEEGVELGCDTLTVPCGSDTISAVHALGFAIRMALVFGGIQPGQAEDIRLYNRRRIPALVMALGQVDEPQWATAVGAESFGFPTITDARLPGISPIVDPARHIILRPEGPIGRPVLGSENGAAYLAEENPPPRPQQVDSSTKLPQDAMNTHSLSQAEAMLSLPWEDIPGNEGEKVTTFVRHCLETRGIKVQASKPPLPVAYDSAFLGEHVRRQQLRLECGGRYQPGLEWLSMAELSQIVDGRTTVFGPDLADVAEGGVLPLAILVRVAGRKMQKDFEPVLERQFHNFLNAAQGVQHTGQRDSVGIRISKAAAGKGLKIKHLGDIIHSRLHAEFSAIVDKVEITLLTNKSAVLAARGQAREVYRTRDERVARLTDSEVDTFYGCAICQSIAPNHVCVISPERVGLCGVYNWLDCKASAQINPSGPNQPAPKGRLINPVKGEWDGINKFVYQHSNKTIERVTLYSLLDAPMTSCGFLECITMVIPEANGVMVVSREDAGLTPAGMTFSALADMVGAGLQTPGMMGHGLRFITSKQYLAAEGGLARVVWMSSDIKDQLADELAEACQRIGQLDLVKQIADERVATTIEELLVYLTEKGHPALTLDPLF